MRFHVTHQLSRPDSLSHMSYLEVDSLNLVIFTLEVPVWWISDIEYSCVEQYYQRAKAICMGRDETAAEIMLGSDPATMKRLGDTVKMSAAQWKKFKAVDVMEQRAFEKFAQNPELQKALKVTKDIKLVECNKYDSFWAIGLSMYDDMADDEKKWKGNNKLGAVLEKVRSQLSGQVVQLGHLRQQCVQPRAVLEYPHDFVCYRQCGQCDTVKMSAAQWKKFKAVYVMEQGAFEKFAQNPELQKTLKVTKDIKLVECNKYDSFWAIGLSMYDDMADDEKKWKGDNKLGAVLEKVRSQLSGQVVQLDIRFFFSARIICDSNGFINPMSFLQLPDGMINCPSNTKQ